MIIKNFQLEKEIEAKEIEHRNQNLNGQISDLSGQISGVNNSSRSNKPTLPSLDSNKTDFNTLDEPIWDTINRDLGQVTAKFSQVLLPTPDKKNVLRDWDLWVIFNICCMCI